MGKSKCGSSKKAGKAVKVAKLPKKKCCVSSTKCNRCPLRMLKEGTLPAGYTVKKRKLVKIDVVTAKGGKKGKKAAKAA
ncbi:hypothetical protein [Nocardioides sp.]|uniref:hypothetical protein n=1 Tax=Nocardioides sp. TaxID=35761 RepID=UPI0035B0CA22